MVRYLKSFSFIFYQIARPVSYLRIHHEDKWIYDWLIPAILTGLTIAPLAWLSDLPAVVGDDGLLASITGFVENLPGFFIAALAAVATFNKHDIDQLMNNPPKVSIMYQGTRIMVEMTRRRFLCVLFSYLTATSIFIVICFYLGKAIGAGGDDTQLLGWGAALAYFFIFWQMITATLLGLYYLGERLHTPDS